MVVEQLLNVKEVKIAQLLRNVVKSMEFQNAKVFVKMPYVDQMLSVLHKTMLLSVTVEVDTKVILIMLLSVAVQYQYHVDQQLIVPRTHIVMEKYVNVSDNFFIYSLDN